MKSFTDIEQSKKLAEILPSESVDMCYRIVAYNPNNTHVYQPYCFVKTLESDIPCWSLAALIGLLPNGTVLTKSDSGRYFIGGLLYDNLLDACVNMIFTLKEREDLI